MRRKWEGENGTVGIVIIYILYGCIYKTCEVLLILTHLINHLNSVAEVHVICLASCTYTECKDIANLVIICTTYKQGEI